MRAFLNAHWRLVCIAVILIVIGISIEVGKRILKNYYIGVREADAHYFVPVQNPLNSTETFSLEIRMRSATFAAHTWSHFYIVMYPSADYQVPVSVNNSRYPATYYVIFEDSQCTGQTDSNFAVGHSCIFPIIRSEDGSRYTSQLNAKGEEETVFYNFDGTYGILFAAKDHEGQWIFGNSDQTDFIRVAPVDVVYNIAYSKLTLFVTALSIEIAVLTTIAVIILKKH